MKSSWIAPVLSFISLAALCIFSAFSAFDKPAATASDSTGKACDVVTHPLLSGHALRTMPDPASSAMAPGRIPESEAKLAARFNEEFPVLKAEGKYVNGFMLDPKDFKNITALNPATLFFRIGVSNYKDSVDLRARRKEPSYTILVIPLNADNTQMKDSKGELIAFDFTCPCPSNSTCCPKQ